MPATFHPGCPCPMCWRDQLPTCNRCDELVSVQFTAEGYPAYSEPRYLCLSCAMIEWHHCELCSTFYYSALECAGHCARCCDYYVDYADDDDDDEQESFDDAGVRSYSYKPDPEFHGDGRVYMGLELEIETCGTRAYSMCADVAAQHLGALGYLKEDGSIRCGFEIVTHPMTHEYAVTAFPWAMLDELAINGAYAGESAGLHVHVNRAGFDSPSHIYRWLKLVYRNQNPVTAIARRYSDEWAPFERSARRMAKEYAKGERYAPRYAAINVTNTTTFEMRVFASSLNAQQVRAALDLVAASVEYTRYLTVREIVSGGWTWNSFIEWANERGVYAALIAENEVYA